MKNANTGRLGHLLRGWNTLSSPGNCWRRSFGELALSLLSFRGPHTSGNPESRNKTKSFSNKQTGSQVHAWDDDYNNGSPNPAGRRVSGSTSCVVSRGFTLIELLVVVLIIGILASVALPQYTKAVEKSRAAEALTVVRAIKVANEAYFMATGSYSYNLNNLVIQIPGKDGNYNGVPRKESKFFSFAASANVVGVGNVVALGNRFPLATKYIIFALPNTDALYCKFYSAAGEQICEQLGDSKYASNVYVIN